MAANDEFPRGCLQTSGTAITYPALPGISWVLTEASAAINNTAPGNVSTYGIQAVCGSVSEILAGVSNDPSYSYLWGNGQWEGSIKFPEGAAVTIQLAFYAGSGPYQIVLETSAYPI